MSCVLDASAVLAWLQQEAGAEVVDEHLYNGVISSVNWSEVLQKTVQHGRDAYETGALLEALGLAVAEATKADAEMAARLWDASKPLSLGDRFCLATAGRLSLSVVTAERAWADIDVGLDVILIR